MTELKVFRPRLAQRQRIPFNVERASVVLVASDQRRQQVRTAAVSVPLSSEWRDPCSLRLCFA